MDICKTLVIAESLGGDSDGVFWGVLAENGFDGSDVVAHYESDDCALHPKSDLIGPNR